MIQLSSSIIKAKLTGISSFFNAYKKVKTLFPTEPETIDNSWILQNIFYNGNFNRKNPNNNTTVHLTPGFYGIPERNHTLTVLDFFPRGIFISKESLEEKIESRLVQLSYNSLKTHIKSKIGQHKKYQAIPLRCNQRKGTHPTIKSLMTKNKSGSGIYRRILSRGDKQSDINNPTSWGKKLNDDSIT